jgi:GT2 family glycosyltransferase
MEAENPAKPLPIRFVVASRLSKQAFLERTALGQCLAHFLGHLPIEVRLFQNNTQGLPTRYNEAIEEARSSPAVLVFVHDDVHLLGYFFADEIRKALKRFEVVGIVGNRRRVPRQPSWAFSHFDDSGAGIWDAAGNLSGAMGYGKGSQLIGFNDFGPTCQEVKLLDGMLLAAESSVLLANEVFFDERFDFHFYDLDFCRQAEMKGLRLGTWNISAIHEGLQSLDTPEWKRAYACYLEKWQS